MPRIRARWFTLALVLAIRIDAQVERIDLKSFGYSLPPTKPVRPPWESLGADLRSRPIAIFPDDNVLVSFVTGKQPSLILHLINFNRKGEFLNEKKVPTTGWYENGIYMTGQGNTLVRTASMLKLYSSNGEVLAEKQLTGDRTRILPIPAGQAFALLRESENIEVLDARDLTSSKKCSEMAPIRSVSEHNVLLDVPVSRYPPVHRLELHEICGASLFAYEWGELPDSATLLDDTRIALTGPNVVVMSKAVKLWTDSFKHDVGAGSVSASANGNTFAVEALHMDAAPKSIRIIVYNSENGKHLAEVPVEHLPKYAFDFAISPDGKLLAILSDGELRVVPIQLR
jgi:hypothetical protein